MQNFDLIQDTSFAFLFLERETRKMSFQKNCKAKSMQEEREKRRKTMQKMPFYMQWHCFHTPKSMLLHCNNTALPHSNTAFIKPLFICNRAKIAPTWHNYQRFYFTIDRSSHDHLVAFYLLSLSFYTHKSSVFTFLLTPNSFYLRSQ